MSRKLERKVTNHNNNIPFIEEVKSEPKSKAPELNTMKVPSITHAKLTALKSIAKEKSLYAIIDELTEHYVETKLTDKQKNLYNALVAMEEDE